MCTHLCAPGAPPLTHLFIFRRDRCRFDLFPLSFPRHIFPHAHSVDEHARHGKIQAAFAPAQIRREVSRRPPFLSAVRFYSLVIELQCPKIVCLHRVSISIKCLNIGLIILISFYGYNESFCLDAWERFDAENKETIQPFSNPYHPRNASVIRIS